jgi:hypothetical protein
MSAAKGVRPAQHIQMDDDGELLVIQGDLHFYRLFRSTGRTGSRSPTSSKCCSIASAIPSSNYTYARQCWRTTRFAAGISLSSRRNGAGSDLSKSTEAKRGICQNECAYPTRMR